MSIHKKLLWSEGLFISPQHFQQQDKHYQDRLRNLHQRMTPFPFGLIDIAINEEELKHGKFKLEKFHGVFPDGEHVVSPEGAPPPSIDLNSDDLPTSFIVYLALPQILHNSHNCDADDINTNIKRRYRRHIETEKDIVGEAPETEIFYLQHNLSILLEFHNQENYTTLPIAKLEKQANGRFALNKTFIPPLLSINSSRVLNDMLSKLLSIMEAKSNILIRQQREKARNVVQFGAGDVTQFWLLHCIQGTYPLLRHAAQFSSIHPEELFKILSQFLGMMYTFNTDKGLSMLPKYQHYDLEKTFSDLDAQISSLLETVISTKYRKIDLVRSKPSYLSATLEPDIPSQATFYLAVEGQISKEMLQDLPYRVKAGSADLVENLVLSAMPGCKIVACPTPPPHIPFRVGTHYYYIEANGEIYNEMLKSHNISLYIPNSLKGINIELFLVLPDEQ